MKFTRLAATTGLVVAAGIGAVALAGPAAAYPSGTQAVATINATTFSPGSAVTVLISRAAPGGVLSMTFASTPVTLASGPTVDSAGNGSITGTIPANAEAGNHTITVSSTKGEQFAFGVTVGGTSGGGTSGGTSTTTGGAVGGSRSGGGLASTGAAVTGIGVLGAALVAGGVFFVMAGRKREDNTTV